jgi:hypothetical protein
MIAVEGLAPLRHSYDDEYAIAIDPTTDYLHQAAEHAPHLFLHRTRDILQSCFEDFYEDFRYLSNGAGSPIRMSN